jgi:hypothetical protein
MEKEEKSEGQRRLSKSAFCSRYQEKELATRENVAMQNLEILTYRDHYRKVQFLPMSELGSYSPGD